MRKLALAGLVFYAAMAVGVAQAEPLKLSNTQMDEVSAGVAFALAVAGAAAAGPNVAATATNAQTVALDLGIVNAAASLSQSASFAN